jgi:hypothetical protein
VGVETRVDPAKTDWSMVRSLLDGETTLPRCSGEIPWLYSCFKMAYDRKRRTGHVVAAHQALHVAACRWQLGWSGSTWWSRARLCVVREKGSNLLLLNEVMQRIRPSGWPMYVGAAGKTGSCGGFGKTGNRNMSEVAGPGLGHVKMEKGREKERPARPGSAYNWVSAHYQIGIRKILLFFKSFYNLQTNLNSIQI